MRGATSAHSSCCRRPLRASVVAPAKPYRPTTRVRCWQEPTKRRAETRSLSWGSSAWIRDASEDCTNHTTCVPWPWALNWCCSRRSLSPAASCSLVECPSLMQARWIPWQSMVWHSIRSLSGLAMVPASPPAFQVMKRVRGPASGGLRVDGVAVCSGRSPRVEYSELSWCR